MGEELEKFLSGLIGSNTGNLLAGLGGFGAQNEAIKDIRGLGKDATTAIYGQNYTVPQGGLIGEIDRQSTFKPFGVTTATGSRAGFSSTGNLDTMLSPTEQALQERMLGFGSRAFGFLDDPAAREQEQGEIIRMLQYGDTNTPQASQLNQFGSSMFDAIGDPVAREKEQTALMNMLANGNIPGREANIMSRLQASVAPEQERARLQLEERLAGQGRLGVQTSMFGGTPEALALEKAIAEQNAGFGVSAMEQARAEQAQESNQRLASLQEFRNRTQLAGMLGLDAMREARAGQAQKSEQALAGLGETRNRFDLLGQLGLQSLPAAYQGQNQLLANLNPALDAFRTSQALRATGLTTGAGLAESGLEAQLGFEGLAAALRQQQFQGLFDLLKGEQAAKATASSQPMITIGSGGFGFNPNSPLFPG
jgi:hypothetical protein